MSLKSIAILKNYFLNGKRPPQENFFDLIDSFIHKDGAITIGQITDLQTYIDKLGDLQIADIENLQTVLNNLADIQIDDVTGLRAVLDALAVIGIEEVTGLQTALDAVTNSINNVANSLTNYVTKETGKGLSSNDFSTGYINTIQSLIDNVTLLNSFTYITIVTDATAARTITADDLRKRIIFTNASPIALTIATQAVQPITVGTKIDGTVKGNGAVTISGAGVELIGNTLTFPKGETFTLVNVGPDSWTVEGNGTSGVITTVKSIVSTSLSTQNVAGFVTYINALTPIVSAASNEILKYNLTDTGRIFEITLRGRSFGQGQPAIIASNVLEVTDFLNKDIKLSNYSNTRNDGANPTNRVLGTDASGNIKLYGIGLFPAPYVSTILPLSLQPSSTTQLTINGYFFTPNTTVSIANCTINNLEFLSDNQMRMNVVTTATEQTNALIVNNGSVSTYADRILVITGTPNIPQTSDFTMITGNLDRSKAGELSLINNVTSGKVEFFNVLASQNFQLRFNPRANPIKTDGSGVSGDIVEIWQGGEVKFACYYYYNGYNSFCYMFLCQKSTGFGYGTQVKEVNISDNFNDLKRHYFERIGPTLYFKKAGVILHQFTDVVASEDFKFRIKLTDFDMINIMTINI
jgi:hypothetical protein